MFIRESGRQAPATSLDVFISYSRSDSDLARLLNDELQIRGKTTWFDQESIASGADFQQEIYRGIESADNFLFILSPRSINSPYCGDEVEYAAKLNEIKSQAQYILSLSNNNQTFDSLIAAIKIGKTMQKEHITEPIAMVALKKSVFETKEYNRLANNSDGIFTISFSPDGKTLASGNFDNTIILWNLDFDLNHLLERGCNFLHAYLHNPDSDANDSDRHLCDDIGMEKNQSKSP